MGPTAGSTIRTVRIIIVAATASLAAATAARADPDPPVLTDVRVTRDGGTYAAACRLVGGLNAETLEEIDSGLETTIAYRLYVYRRRPGIPDEPVVKHRVKCTVQHDALTRQYTLTRRIDGELQETRVTPDADAMRAFLTTLDHVPLMDVAEAAADQQYYLKAKSDLGLVWRFYLIPWRLDTAWVQVPIETARGNGADPPPGF